MKVKLLIGIVKACNPIQLVMVGKNPIVLLSFFGILSLKKF